MGQPQGGGTAPSAGQIVVLGADGEAAVGARLIVLRQGRPDAAPTETMLVDSRTGEGGVPDAAVPRLADLQVVVDHPMHLPFIASYPGALPPQTLRLRAGQVLTGEVVGRESDAAVAGAIAGAEVCASWVDPQAPARFQRWRRCAASSETGRFDLAGLPAAPVEVAVSSPGFADLAASSEPDGGPLRLVLEAVADEVSSSSGAGRVLVEVAGADGVPVDRFTMRIESASGGRRMGSAVDVEQTEVPATANVPAEFLGAGMVAVSFEAENHLRSGMQGVQMFPGGEVDLGVVFLESGAVVRGRIFDAVGAEPAAGCLVELLVTGAGEIRAALEGGRPLAVSDEEGSYVLGGLAAGRYHLRRDCYGAPRTSTLVVLGSSETLDLGETWRHGGASVVVRVEGMSEGRVQVLDRFREVRTPLAEAALQPAGESGVAELVLAPGVYRFEGLDAAGEPRVAQEFEVDPGGPGETQTIRLAASSRTIRSVLTMDGRPVAGGAVSFGAVLEPGRGAGTMMLTTQAGGAARSTRMFRPGGSTFRSPVSSDGSFEVQGAPADLLWMSWYAPDGSSASRLWPEGALAQLDLSGARVHGVLLDQEGRPASGQVGLVGDLGREVASASSSEDGQFTLPPAPPGRYLLRGRLAAGSVVQELLLTEQAPAPLLLRLPAGDPGRIELSLERPGGEPAAGAWLHLVDAAGDVAGTGLVSGRGRYAKDGLPEGDLSLIWNDGMACVGGTKVTIEGGETTQERLTLPTGRLLELRCPAEDCAGAPLTFLSVRNEADMEVGGHLSGAASGVRFSDRGAVGIGCVTPGAYELSFWTAGLRWAAEVDVDPDGDEEAPVVVRGRPADL